MTDSTDAREIRLDAFIGQITATVRDHFHPTGDRQLAMIVAFHAFRLAADVLNSTAADAPSERLAFAAWLNDEADLVREQWRRT